MAAYVNIDYYINTFKGESIDATLFERLAIIASDVINSIVMRPIDATVDTDMLAKAAAYQVEYLAAQGGISAVTGHAESQLAVSETLEEYSISETQTDAAKQNQASIGGIPISPMTLSTLRRLGLMSRWLYAGRRCPHGF